ncbi:MAG TPA: PIG-L deacetylase family protein [Polyangiaceae bacterium]|nr:PIG-L deacetylase family protein [Polyangiaceae bacterium]
MLPISLGPGSTKPLRILCLGAHSDDIEIGCGGTILKLLEAYPGSSVTWVVFSSNDLREAEARGSAAAFLESAAGSNVIVHRFKESYFPHAGSEIKDSFEELKRSATPDVVLSHHRHDVHQDHRTIAELTWNTFRNHLILEYEIPKYEGDLGHPGLYVTLSAAQASRKVELLLKHFASQAGRSWFRPETFRGLMTVRGIECNAPDGAAEAFHVRKAVL